MENYKEKYEQALGKVKTFVQRWEGIEINSDLPIQELQEIFPELKESEDERIRKELLRAFTVTADKREREIYGNGITYGQVLDWLEKQSSKDYNPYKATVESISAMVEKYTSFDSNLQDFYNNVKIKCKDAAEYDKTWPENQDYQKPAAYFYCKYEGVMPLCSDCKRNHLNSKYETEEIETWMVPALRCTKRCFSYIQQKPIRWSEEDEIILNKIIQDYKAASKSFCGHQGKLDWLKSLKPQPKQVWSDEDEKIKYEIEIILANTNLFSKFELNYTFSDVISWLKSIKEGIKGE